MIVSHLKEVTGVQLDDPRIKNVVKKVLVSPNEGWEGWVMRAFELGEGGFSPKHTHPYPHINYMIKGKGILHIDGVDHEVEEGSFAFVPGESTHQFLNRGEEPFVFICIVPEEGDVLR